MKRVTTLPYDYILVLSDLVNTVDRIGQDLWPHRRKYLVRRALRAAEGQIIRLSLGEAETLARRETEREIAKRLKLYETLDNSQKRPIKTIITIKMR